MKKQSKIILAAINARYSHSNPAIYYLKSYTMDLDYTIIIKEFNINEVIDEIVDTIIGEKSAAVGFSAYIWNVEIIKNILPVLNEKNPEIRIIMGGPEVSYNPQWWFENYSEIDYIITGHGEEGFRYLLSNEIDTDEKIISIKNKDFSSQPFLYDEEDFSLLENRYIYYESSRGCAFKCTYCLSSRSDQLLQFRDVQKVRDEIKAIVLRKPHLIKFIDRSFNSNKKHARRSGNI